MASVCHHDRCRVYRVGETASNVNQLICSHRLPSFEARVFRIVPEAGETTEENEGIKVHGRPKGVHHPAG